MTVEIWISYVYKDKESISRGYTYYLQCILPTKYDMSLPLCRVNYHFNHRVGRYPGTKESLKTVSQIHVVLSIVLYFVGINESK